MLRIQSLHGLATLALTTGALLGCGGEDTRPDHGSMAGQLDRTLESLGAPAPTSVRVRGDGGVVLFHRRFAEAGDRAGAPR